MGTWWTVLPSVLFLATSNYLCAFKRNYAGVNGRLGLLAFRFRYGDVVVDRPSRTLLLLEPYVQLVAAGRHIIDTELPVFICAGTKIRRRFPNSIVSRSDRLPCLSFRAQLPISKPDSVLFSVVLY